MKTKPIPAIVMMIAGLITCFLCIRNQVPTIDFLRRLLLVLILFYILGIIIKGVLDFFFNGKDQIDVSEEELNKTTPDLDNKEIEVNPNDGQ